MQRQRLTITLSKNTIETVDQAIDGAKIRNRSHAIEYLIQNSSTPKLGQALILAGGTGVKLRPLGKEIPKALLPLHHKPALEYTIDLLRKHDITDIFISTGPEGTPIKQHFGDGTQFGVHITYLTQHKSNVGTAAAVRQAKSVFSQPFLLLYGDVLADINVGELIEYHRTKDCVTTMALTSAAATADWGVVKMHGSQITNFVEKPPAGSTQSYVINAGIYVMQPEVFDFISQSSKKLEQDLFPNLAKAGKLAGYVFDGQWFDVGSTKMYAQAQKLWQN